MSDFMRDTYFVTPPDAPDTVIYLWQVAHRIRPGGHVPLWLIRHLCEIMCDLDDEREAQQRLAL